MSVMRSWVLRYKKITKGQTGAWKEKMRIARLVIEKAQVGDRRARCSR